MTGERQTMAPTGEAARDDNPTSGPVVILRDRLAGQRTIMANDRTLMAVIRTFLSLSGAGVALVKIFDHSIMLGLGLICLVGGFVVMGLGLINYRRTKRIIAQEAQLSDEEQYW